MNKNSVEKVKQEQQYKILIRNLRKQKEEKENEKTNDKKTDSNPSKWVSVDWPQYEIGKQKISMSMIRWIFWEN